MDTSVHEIILKKCSSCKLDLPIYDFYRDNRSKDKKARECNAGIGFFKDRIDVLSSAINYLQKNGS